MLAIGVGRGHPPGSNPAHLSSDSMPQIPPLTRALMLACTAIFCVQQLVFLSGAFALWPLASGNFMPWQMVSYAFLHGGIGHLFFNMLGLWMFGSELERLWGQRRYWQFLLAGVLTAAIAQLVITALTGSRVPTVGASGGLYALLLAFGMLFPNRVIMPLFPPIPMKARTFVIVFGALELLLGLMDVGGVAHFAHLGGMVGGFLMIRYWRGQSPFRPRRRR
jgi:membrane associated rhomboid family serine protease